MDLIHNLNFSSLDIFPYRELSLQEIYKLLDKNVLCRLGLCEGNKPYVLPMYYYYCIEKNDTYFYMTSKFTKNNVNSMLKNKHVSIEVDSSVDDTCNANYKSIIISGEIVSIESIASSNKIIENIFNDSIEFIKKHLNNRKDNDLVLIKIKVNTIIGRETLL